MGKCQFYTHPNGPCEGARYAVTYPGGLVKTACPDWAQWIEYLIRRDGDKNDRTLTSLGEALRDG